MFQFITVHKQQFCYIKAKITFSLHKAEYNQNKFLKEKPSFIYFNNSLSLFLKLFKWSMFIYQSTVNYMVQ